MSNFTSTIEYKFKVTNNLDKTDAQQKKFNFYLGLPYSKRKYRYMQVVNFIIKDGTHLFTVILGHSESSVAAMSDDILRNERSAFKPAVTKVMRITYASVNVGQVAFLCNASNKKIFEGADWTGISGEYTKIKSFRTNGNDEVLGLIFDAADRNVVSARKNDGTNVVARAEASADEVKLDPILLTPTARKAIKDRVDDLKKANQGLEQKLEGREKDVCTLIEQIDEKDRTIKTLIEERELLKKDLEHRDKDISDLEDRLEEKERYIKGLENDSVKMFQNMDWRRKYIELVLAVLKRDFSHMKDDELVANVQGLIGIPVKEK